MTSRTTPYIGITKEEQDGPAEQPLHRTHVLETANDLITGDRAGAYGNYRDQMTGIADAFNGLYNGIEGAPFLEPRHVSVILMLLKQRRRVTAGDLDSSVDLCGYAALDAEYFTQ